MAVVKVSEYANQLRTLEAFATEKQAKIVLWAAEPGGTQAIYFKKSEFRVVGYPNKLPVPKFLSFKNVVVKSCNQHRPEIPVIEQSGPYVNVRYNPDLNTPVPKPDWLVKAIPELEASIPNIGNELQREAAKARMALFKDEQNDSTDYAYVAEFMSRKFEEYVEYLTSITAIVFAKDPLVQATIDKTHPSYDEAMINGLKKMYPSPSTICSFPCVKVIKYKKDNVNKETVLDQASIRLRMELSSGQGLHEIKPVTGDKTAKPQDYVLFDFVRASGSLIAYKGTCIDFVPIKDIAKLGGRDKPAKVHATHENIHNIWPAKSLISSTCASVNMSFTPGRVNMSIRMQNACIFRCSEITTAFGESSDFDDDFEIITGNMRNIGMNAVDADQSTSAAAEQAAAQYVATVNDDF